jgi:uncharacterized protein (TIGR02145 family)
MQMRKLLAIMLILCSAVFGQKSKLIISVSGELEMDLADVLMDGVSYGLKNNNKYEILINDRQFKETLKKEWDKGNISDDRIIALAKTAGAAYLCFTKIKVANGLKGKQVTAHMYNLSTMSYVPGEMGMVTIKDDFYDLEDLTKIILNVVADMLGIAKDNSVRQTSKVSKDARDGKEASSSNNTYTPKSQGGNFFTDSRDGKKYKTVKIGKQTWMAENLNYNANGSKCNNNQESNCSNYGRLYNWATAMNACPSGWHLPNKSEWEVLTATVGGKETEGKYLKATSGWDSYNGQSGNGQDTYGFSALPGGQGISNGNAFYFPGIYGYWWSASEISASLADSRYMSFNFDAGWFNGDKSTHLLSVRCLQD